jgi:thiaminase (transcriptional activator TenA)
MLFSDRLRQTADPIWQKILDHPFVTELGDGVLPLEKYRYYICQDHAYLRDYAKVFAMASINAPTADLQLEYNAECTNINNELVQEEKHCVERFGITRDQLLNVEMTPANHAYVNFMLRVGFLGNCTDITAAILPCAWTYYDIGRTLAARGHEGCNHELYGPWIEMYNTQHKQCDWLTKTLNALVEDCTPKQLDQIEKNFVLSTRFEYMFFDMAYYQHDWPV